MLSGPPGGAGETAGGHDATGGAGHRGAAAERRASLRGRRGPPVSHRALGDGWQTPDGIRNNNTREERLTLRRRSEQDATEVSRQRLNH